jgi:hypothetical protein
MLYRKLIFQFSKFELQSAALNKNQVSNYQQQQQTNASAKHMKDEEKNAKNMFRKSFTISDDFMKWCHEQLKDFNADCMCL